MKPGYRLSLIASAITLLAILLINTLINLFNPATSTDELVSGGILETLFEAFASIYLGILLVLVMTAVVALLRQRKTLGAAILVAIIFSLLTVIAASSAFSSTHYLYVAASLLIGVTISHLLNWRSVRNYFLIALIVTIIVVMSIRLWMLFY